MKVAKCTLVGGEAQTRALVESVSRQIFPGATVEAEESLAGAMKSPPENGLLVLHKPDEATLARAAGEVDADGLRRWAILVLGATAGAKGAAVLPLKELDERTLRQAMRSAAAQWELMREIDRANGDFRTLGFRINHDLRTPLGGVLGAAEVMREVWGENDPGKLALLEPIFKSVEDQSRVLERVSQLLKAGATPATKRTLAMQEVVWAALQRLDRAIARNGSEVRQPETWPELEAVASWTEAVWDNLLANALRHAGKGAHLRLGWDERDGDYFFWVDDDGAGVPEEKQGMLLQPFQLLHGTNARRGLGLSIVRRLVELQGGTCGYEPLTAGSRFYFTLPRAPGEPAAKGHKARPAVRQPA